ncbi:MAG: hypothetical protein K1X44_05900 [Alphaproteobacteria bacterium]|nr:hypothetical protein [Alphaproteobacteria bacterium]
MKALIYQGPGKKESKLLAFLPLCNVKILLRQMYTTTNIGVHGVKTDLHLKKTLGHNITITTRLVDTIITPTLLKTVQSNKLNPKQLITHHFILDKILESYEIFQSASNPGFKSYY